MQYLVIIILSFALSAIMSWLLIPRILFVAFEKKLFDLPDERKIHCGVVPRLGGVTFVPTFIFTLMFALFLLYTDYVIAGYTINEERLPECFLLICGLTLIFLIGMADDLVGVKYRKKFLVQLLAASFIPLSGFWINNWYGLFGVYELPIWVGIPFTIFIVALITNAINLIDGLDGLAAGLAAMAFTVVGIIFIKHNILLYSLITFIMLGMIIPFFIYNVFGNPEKRKKIFMGDTGSLTLGYMLSFILIRYISSDETFLPAVNGRFMIALSLIFVPTFDVLRVMIVRIRKGKSPFNPDKNHIHHKFLSVGFSPMTTLITIMILDITHIMVSILTAPFLNINIVFAINLFIWLSFHTILSAVRAKRKLSMNTTNTVAK